LRIRTSSSILWDILKSPSENTKWFCFKWEGKFWKIDFNLGPHFMGCLKKLKLFWFEQHYFFVYFINLNFHKMSFKVENLRTFQKSSEEICFYFIISELLEKRNALHKITFRFNGYGKCEITATTTKTNEIKLQVCFKSRL
jgi:hypothetical protein